MLDIHNGSLVHWSHLFMRAYGLSNLIFPKAESHVLIITYNIES